VLQPADNLPGFWIFMYRVSPFTYFVEGMLGVAVADTIVECSPIEFLQFEPANGQDCQTYMAPYIQAAGGYLRDTAATTNCEFCALRDTNTFLTSFGLNYGNRWRNFGILWAYCIVNIAGAILFYWIFRVPKNSGKEKPTEDGTPEPEKKIEGGGEKPETQEKRN
jgi:ATP-binding cassette subfamily G (WHITE) protein 2 (PDR)